MTQRDQRRGWHQYFVGGRVDCESAPLLPSRAVACVFNDPRRLPYLMIWKDEFSDEVIEAVRVAAYEEPNSLDWSGWMEIKRIDGSRSLIRTIERCLPRNGGKALLLICPLCQSPRRSLYGWRLNPFRPNSAFKSSWECRQCARLRYASEGGALVFRPLTSFGRLIESIEGRCNHPRPQPCYPYVFANPVDAEAILH